MFININFVLMRIAAVAVTLLLMQQHLIKTKVTTLDKTMVVK